MEFEKEVTINITEALEMEEKEIYEEITGMKHDILNKLNETVKVYEKDYILLLAKILRVFIYNLDYAEAIINIELLLKEDIKKNPEAFNEATNILYFEVLALRPSSETKRKYESILKYFELKLKDKN